ncbi:MAG: ribbon-helix-helix protein, CopG family [Micrococcales bacterium]|nr:ribbon-helix-helix protein, CopG family [Micrococcales bacterium]
MDEEETLTPETVALFEADAAEAEAGHSIEWLRTRPIILTRGRPLRLGDAAGQRIQFRLAPEQLARLDKLAERDGETRSEVIRRAIQRELATA